MVMAAESTARKQQIGRPFLPGQSGNPLGRPKGSRNRLAEDFLRDLADDFAKHGKEAIEQVREKRPGDYLKIISSILPKEMSLEVAADLKIEVTEFVKSFELLRQAKETIGVPLLIEAELHD